jgi:hypothetical protein
MEMLKLVAVCFIQQFRAKDRLLLVSLCADLPGSVPLGVNISMRPPFPGRQCLSRFSCS